MVKNLPASVSEAADKLDYTSGYMISIGLNRKVSFPSVWFYIYDEDILPARIYFADKKSPNNAPEGCSALQAEVYVSKYRQLKLSMDELKDTVIRQLLKLNLFTMEDAMEYNQILPSILSFCELLISSRKKMFKE